MIGSVGIGALLGIPLVLAPNVAGDTAIADPGWLGAMWFMRPRSLLVLVPPLIHFSAGVGLQVLATWIPMVRPRTAALAAVAINGAATLLENAYGAGVMGVGWWLIGSVLSAALMLLGIAAARRLLPSPR